MTNMEFLTSLTPLHMAPLPVAAGSASADVSGSSLGGKREKRRVRITDQVAAKALRAAEAGDGRTVRESVTRLRERGHALEGTPERTIHIRDPRVKHNYESQDALIQELRLLWREATAQIDGDGEDGEDGEEVEDASGLSVGALPPSPLRAVIDHLRGEHTSPDSVSPSLTHDTETYVFLLQDIERKRRGYFYQDAEKDLTRPGICDPARLVSLDDVIVLLGESRGRCHYCDRNYLLYYEYARCNAQWTLDRIDNTKGHWTGNCVVSCLSCNISRGTMDDERFFAGKRMVVRKAP